MIFLNDDRFKNILFSELGYDEEVINAMRLEYIEAVQKVTINATLIYITENNLHEIDQKLEQFFPQDEEEEQERHKKLGEMYEFILKFVKEHPELDQQINEEIRKLDKDVNDMLLQSMGDDALLAIADMFVDDFKMLREIRENYPELPSGPSSKDFQTQQTK